MAWGLRRSAELASQDPLNPFQGQSYPINPQRQLPAQHFMSSNNDSAAHAPASALENSEPSAVAVAAVEGKSLPAGKCCTLDVEELPVY